MSVDTKHRPKSDTTIPRVLDSSMNIDEVSHIDPTFQELALASPEQRLFFETAPTKLDLSKIVTFRDVAEVFTFIVKAQCAFTGVPAFMVSLGEIRKTFKDYCVTRKESLQEETREEFEQKFHEFFGVLDKMVQGWLTRKLIKQAAVDEFHNMVEKYEEEFSNK